MAIFDINTTETVAQPQPADSRPRFLQGVFPFAGKGLFSLTLLDDTLTYTVPSGRATRLVYFRAGNASNDLLYLALLADGVPVRYFPVSPQGDIHVPLAIVELHPPATVLSVAFAAPRGTTGTLIVDVGLVEGEAGQ